MTTFFVIGGDGGYRTLVQTTSTDRYYTFRSVFVIIQRTLYKDKYTFFTIQVFIDK